MSAQLHLAAGPVWILALATSAVTLSGGVLALRLGERLRLATSLTAGAILGVALFDLAPEAFQLGGGDAPSARTLALAVACGFIGYLALRRLLTRVGGEDGRASRLSGHLGAASLTLHSLFDGLAIGLAFHISPAIGWPVALAVLAHDLCDGINTVGLTLTLAGSRRMARRWLAADALAPLVGVAASGLLQLDRETLAPLLGLFAGVFLYLGAVELLPRSYVQRPLGSTTGAALLGLVMIWGVVRLAG
jgi:ZIP family zinc transporter